MSPRSLSQDEIEDFRADLCSVAERLFAERGYDGVTLRAIAGELGCSPMTPYRYFENKDAIFTAVRMNAFLRLGEAIEAAGRGRADAVDRLRALSHAYLDFARREPAAYRIMFEISRDASIDARMLEDPARRDQLLSGWRPLLTACTELVEQGRIHGDPLVHAHLGWLMLHGLVTLELSRKLLLGRDFDALVEPLIEHYLRGLGALPDPDVETEDTG